MKTRKPAIYIGSDIYRRPSFGTNHPLSNRRQGSVFAVCRQLAWLPPQMFVESPIADVNTLLRFHDLDYITSLMVADDTGSVSSEARKRYNFGTMENPLFEGVFIRAATTVGGSIAAAKAALNGHIAFHPSGGTHHGQKNRASGFCYFNDPVFAILTFLDAGIDRVLYVDIDAHHGDGVQAAFEGETRVSCISIHEDNRWPYSGNKDEQTANTINIPVAAGINDSEYDYIFEQLILPYCDKWKPQSVVITCGADALAGDPLSKMALSNNALWQAVESLCAIIPACVVLGGGGYNPWTTTRCWAGLWGQLAGFPMPTILPDTAQAILSQYDSDLIDEEDRDPLWITTLQDKPNVGPVGEDKTELIKELSTIHL